MQGTRFITKNKIYNKVFEEQEVKVGKDKILKEIGEDPEEEMVTNRGGDKDRNIQIII